MQFVTKKYNIYTNIALLVSHLKKLAKQKSKEVNEPPTCLTLQKTILWPPAIIKQESKQIKKTTLNVFYTMWNFNIYFQPKQTSFSLNIIGPLNYEVSSDHSTTPTNFTRDIYV